MDQTQLPPPSQTSWTSHLKTLDRILVLIVECLLMASILGIAAKVLPATHEGQILFSVCAWLFSIAVTVLRFRSWWRSRRRLEKEKIV